MTTFSCTSSMEVDEKAPGMETQNRAIALSNHGAALLVAGQFVAAMEAFSEALCLCRQSMHEVVDVDDATLGTSLDACMAPTTHAQVSSGERYVYQQPMRIPENVGNNYRACVFASTMVTFNLALVQQLMASHCSTTSVEQARALLRKAGKLYQLAFNMQQEENFDQNTLFVLATVNNLGLIHSQLNDRKAADQCFEYLLSSLMYLAHSGDVRLKGFLRNATTQTQHKSQSAPAA